MESDKYILPADLRDRDDYEVIVIRHKRTQPQPSSPFFSVILALMVGYFTIALLTESNPEPQPPQPALQAVQPS